MRIPLLPATLVVALMVAHSTPSAAQRLLFPEAGVPGRSATPWLVTAGVAAGLATLALVDGPVQSFLQDSRSSTFDDASGVFGPFGAPQVYLPVGASILAAGLLSGSDRLLQGGARVGITLATAGVLTRGIKYATGRDRPSAGLGSDNFYLFSNRTSFPSGHTAMAFALAGSVAYEIDRPWATVSLHALAALTGWSRLNDNLHWITDVAAGAVLGHLSARFVRSHLTWGSSGPSVGPALVSGGVGLSLSVGL